MGERQMDRERQKHLDGNLKLFLEGTELGQPVTLPKETLVYPETPTTVAYLRLVTTSGTLTLRSQSRVPSRPRVGDVVRRGDTEFTVRWAVWDETLGVFVVSYGVVQVTIPFDQCRAWGSERGFITPTPAEVQAERPNL